MRDALIRLVLSSPSNFNLNHFRCSSSSSSSAFCFASSRFRFLLCAPLFCARRFLPSRTLPAVTAPAGRSCSSFSPRASATAACPVDGAEASALAGAVPDAATSVTTDAPASPDCSSAANLGGGGSSASLATSSYVFTPPRRPEMNSLSANRRRCSCLTSRASSSHSRFESLTESTLSTTSGWLSACGARREVAVMSTPRRANFGAIPRLVPGGVKHLRAPPTQPQYAVACARMRAKMRTITLWACTSWRRCLPESVATPGAIEPADVHCA
mmetsp:Transcript_29874/g.86813  ORF Transcript_29874/g.86813 Transcript_29874/m.86813 type:complete len:271 (-) Transcript_29874:7-819(-)